MNFCDKLEQFTFKNKFRYIRLLFGFNLYSISLETTKRNWEEQIDNLHSLFDTKTKAVKIGNVLLEMLLSGSTDAAGEAFLERGLGTDGLDKIELFATKHMPYVILPEMLRFLGEGLDTTIFVKCKEMSAFKEHSGILIDFLKSFSLRNFLIKTKKFKQIMKKT